MTTRAIGPFEVFLMVCLISFWGSSFVVVKVTLRSGLTPVMVATFRFLVAGAFFLAGLAFMKAANKHRQVIIPRRELPKLLILALTGVTFFFIIQYTGIQMASASIAAILVCLLSPILIGIMSARLFNERLLRRQMTGVGVAAVGTFMVIAGGTLGFQSSVSFLAGSLLLLLTPALWATYTLLGKRVMEKYSPFVVVAYVNILGGLCLIPFSIAEGSIGRILELNLGEWTAILFLAFACSFVGYYIWFYVMNRVKAATASSFLFAEPLVTALLATAFVGEEISPLSAVGGLLTFVGVYFATRGKSA